MSHLRHGRPHRIRGWALVRAPGARLAQRRYLRLVHYTLTVFDGADEDADLVLLEEVLVGARVGVHARRKEVTLRTGADKIVVALRTEREMAAWTAAFTDAVREAGEYYKLVLTRTLGSGAFSTVYFGFDRESGDHAAVKVVDKTRCSRAELAHAEIEARMMAFVQHPAIVVCRDIFDAPDSLHVVMEYMSGRTLEQRMLDRPVGARAFDEVVSATVMALLLDSLAYLEAEGICHRDVKPDNVLLAVVENDDMWATTARLSDFGLAAFVESESELTDIVGTPNYVAPEVLERDANNERVGYGSPVDVWASGIVMHWMLTGGKLPFDGEDSAAIFRSIRKAELPLHSDTWTHISAGAKSLLRALLHPSPRTRLPASCARLHPWLLNASGVPTLASTVAKTRAHGVTRLRPRMRWRVAALVGRAIAALHERIDPYAAAESAAQSRLARIQALKCQKKVSVSEKMMRAPERAPVGTDALGYNVGLFPSLVPKRRARAGATCPGTHGSMSQSMSLRGSTDTVRSGNSSDGGARGDSTDGGLRGNSTDGGTRGNSTDCDSVGSSGKDGKDSKDGNAVAAASTSKLGRLRLRR